MENKEMDPSHNNDSTNQHLKQLLERYVAQSASEEELAVLFNAIREHQMDEVLKEQLDEEMLRSIPMPYEGNGKIRRINWARYLSIAAIFLVVLTGAWIWIDSRKHADTSVATTRYKNDAAPGHSGAILTLSNGKTIVLDSTGNGELTSDQGIKVIKKNGELNYVGETGEIIYNDIKTDRGRTWVVNLPDGSKVWLNAASSIRYPLSFAGGERVVEMTGECYFEVKHDPSHPFKVKVNGEEIDDIGTSFNVNGYMDEAVLKTTLVEGSVKVNNVMLKPGEQMKGKQIEKVEVENEVAWKNGFFSFNHTDLKTVMNQLSRWFDVDVEYQGNVNTEMKVSGEIERDLTLSQVLKGLGDLDVKFKIENKKITILP